MWGRVCCFHEWKKRRDVVTNGIDALKAVWHRGAVDADGRTGDGAGLHIEFNEEFFKEEIKETGHELLSSQTLCVGMIFLPRSNYANQRDADQLWNKSF